MELLVVLLFIGASIALLVVTNSISRHNRELRELRGEQSEMRAALDWLTHIHVEQVHPGAERKPAGPEPEAVPEPAREPVPQDPAVRPAAVSQPPPEVEWGAGARMWKCPSCSHDNLQTAKYCVHCGVGLPEAAEEQPAVTEPEPQAAPAAQPLLTQPITREWWNDFEQVIGKRWMTWVGVLILIAAAGFTVKYMYDMGWLGPWVRVGLEFALGAVIIYLGRHALRHGMVALGHGLLGLGLAVFYVSLYAAYYFHALLSVPVVLLLIAAVTAAGLLLALRYDAIAVAVLATLGGLITPPLVSRGADLQHVLFSYVLVLDLGVLAVALFKRWRILDLVAFFGTALVFAGWAATYYSAALLVPTMLWLGGFYLLFLLLPFVSGLRTGLPLEVEQFLLTLVNAAVMIAASCHFLLPEHPAVTGLCTLGMALLYLLLAAAFKLRLPADERVHYALIALAIFCVTLSVPLLLRFNAITIAWALEAPVLVLLGYYFANRLVRACGFVVLSLALLRVLVMHLPLHEGPFTFFVNAEFGTAACIPLGAAAVALAHHFYRRDAETLDRTLKVTSGIGAGLLGLLLINLEVSLWFEHQWLGPQYSQRYLSLTTLYVVWIAGAALFMLAGIYWRSRAARALSVLLLLVPVLLAVWAYAGTLGSHSAGQVSYLLFMNYRFLAALIAVLVVMGLGWLHAQQAAQLPDDERVIPPLLGIAGGLLALLLLSAEISHWCYLRGIDLGPQLAASLSWQVLVWAAGAVAFLLAGIKLRSHAARATAVLPLLIGLFTGLRAYAAGGEQYFAQDTVLLLNLRFAAGLTMILAVYVYGLLIRRSRLICQEGEQQLATAAYVVANFLLLLLLSTEVYWYCDSLSLPGAQAAQLAQLSLSVVWGVYALAFIIVGFWLDKRVMRLWALGLFGLTALKLLVIDLGHLEPAYRLLSTVVLGLLMIGTSYLYHRVERQLQVRSTADSGGPDLDDGTCQR
jgi:uncharacterized membrane protein